MKNVTPIAAKVPHLNAHNVAMARLFKDRWLNRVDALANCIDHLVIDHDMSEPAAEIAAMQAYADLEAANQVARIDIDATTSHVVVVRTEGGRPVMFTVADLLNVLNQARQEGRAVVVDRERGRPVIIEQ